MHYLCCWINEELLPNEIIEPGHVSVETARKCVHELGFEVLSADRGMFFDGHERDDVVEERNVFLTKTTATCTLVKHQPLNQPVLSHQLTPDICEKTVEFFHDESTFRANEDQTMNGKKNTCYD